MLIENLCIKNGLYNGTHLQFVTLFRDTVNSKITTSDYAGEMVFFPYIILAILNWTDCNLYYIANSSYSFSIYYKYLHVSRTEFWHFGIYINRPPFKHRTFYIVLLKCSPETVVTI